MRRAPRLYGTLALAGEYADELVLATVRDVHVAVLRRAYAVAGRAGDLGRLHEGAARASYAAVGLALNGGVLALRQADRTGAGRPTESWRQGRAVVRTVNGLVGDRLTGERSDHSYAMCVRRDGRDLAPPELADAFPDATGDLAVFVHGLAEDDRCWDLRREERSSYPERLSGVGWTPVVVRMNSGLSVAENGAALAGLLDDVVSAWPVRVRRIALVGHSMGGLVVRAACVVATEATQPWADRVSDVVTLGTPHLGAPLERLAAAGAGLLGVLPESAPFGRILDHRSVGILDLRHGLPRDVANLPRARYHLVAATVSGMRADPVGDLLVRYGSAVGRARGVELFPGADVLHVRGHHFDILNDAAVHDAMLAWLR